MFPAMPIWGPELLAKQQGPQCWPTTMTAAGFQTGPVADSVWQVSVALAKLLLTVFGRYLLLW